MYGGCGHDMSCWATVHSKKEMKQMIVYAD